ncbi:ATP-binding cassette domain-containing protein [Methanocorpusculum vombati]|uniref:ABC transporter ATP-binding protein n=1 Tax=Methanocorpusculum vombati TaxID=3002864 RepID=A0ABT4IJ55_9EURY|nr:ABC transporter ATP-binding protein [Methanocorpusculum vombati]MCZ9319180.1 ABC transporter ATP-binding protein [Methanocorpusculum sp.]MCZ0861763.1 ABC transporter ATP-binding protein [Methanocorpusculum vombati]MDE2521267.1 ABC transporter ATP-binding protein [Methanocorpusculum sp.]MDE2535004.1 ABC transporter ATP-binding protein [Methanocorpusculum sp.]MDE2545552.1 ABC transporter ATP-binding protein [Methanocorpusculum sp.]
MTDDLYDRVAGRTLRELLAEHPVAADFFVNYNLQNLRDDLPLAEALDYADENTLIDFGLDKTTVLDQLVLFLRTVAEEKQTAAVQEITILGGRTKSGEAEEFTLTIQPGEIVSIVGPTGSGKSRLLADIECLAQRDTPTKRQVLVNGRELADEKRFAMDGRLVAQLSQNMNFVMDLSVGEFLEMHAKSRMHPDPAKVAAECFAAANDLAGEKFTPQTKVTQLSGGQSRALMIADTACMSASPIVLIDEIENAGVDRRQAVRMLAKNEKIVLISTHDPLLALMAGKRLVIKNGGVHKIIETTPEERESLAQIERLDTTIQSIRNRLRSGEKITPDTI